MPPRYWQRLTEAELAWGLQTVHQFLTNVVDSETSDTPVVIQWRHVPRFTKVLVCTWDGLGLLNKVAGYISALRLNVARAEVYTRADNIVLDVFWLTKGQGGKIKNLERLRQLAFLLKGGLSNPPCFVSTWACDSHHYLPRSNQIKPVVTFNNTESAPYTMVTIEASERLGLLHDMLKAMTESGLNIVEASIDTIDDVARDTFIVTDEYKKKVVDPDRLQLVESAIVQALLS